MIVRVSILPILILLAAAAPLTGSARDRVPVATPAGEPVSCLPLSSIRESLVRDDRTIDFVTRGRQKVYRVTLPNGCPMLGFEKSFSYATSLSQLCAQDIITVLRQGGGRIDRGASCGLAPFQPVTLAQRR